MDRRSIDSRLPGSEKGTTATGKGKMGCMITSMAVLSNNGTNREAAAADV
jgi:hypothetical protein